MLNHRLKINLFGEGHKIKKIFFGEEQYESWEGIALQMRQPLHLAIIDPYFYFLLNNNKIQCIDDVNGLEWESLINSPKNQIEIWYKNKKVQKLKINDLIEELLLFPLYNTSITSITMQQEKGIYVEQKEIGMIASYELNIDDFIIDDLEFKLIEMNRIMMLRNVCYRGNDLIVKKKDTLITFQNGFEVY